LVCNTDPLPANQQVFVIGHPYIKTNPWDSARGDVSSYDPQSSEFPIDATVGMGNSGGPVINEQNQVVGLFFRIRDKNELSKDSLKRTSMEGISPATRGIGLAHPITFILNKLRTWKVID
jgi:S1-C subfamily serine protease